MKPAADSRTGSTMGSGGSRSVAIAVPVGPAVEVQRSVSPFDSRSSGSPVERFGPFSGHNRQPLEQDLPIEELRKKRIAETGETRETLGSKSTARMGSRGGLIGLSGKATLTVLASSEKKIIDRDSQIKKDLGVNEGGAQTATATSAAPSSKVALVTSSVAQPVAGLPAAPELFAFGDLNTDVTFTPFTFRLWDKSSGGVISSSELNGGLADRKIPVGRYILRFRAPVGGDAKFFAIKSEIPFTIEGKKAVIEKAKLDPVAGTLTVQVNLLQNPIPILLLIAAAAGAIGLGGWGLSESLDSLDKVVVDTSSELVKIAVIGGVAFLVWRFFIK